MVDSVLVNSGRSCINCSGIWASRNTKEIADAIHTIAKSITDSRVFVLEDYASRPIKEKESKYKNKKI